MTTARPPATDPRGHGPSAPAGGDTTAELVALAALIRRGCEGGAAVGQACPCPPCRAWRRWPGPYWGEDAVCPCCGERTPCRAVDVAVGDDGTCTACGLALQAAHRPAGPRCAMHRRWDAQQEAERQRQAARSQPRSRGPLAVVPAAKGGVRKSRAKD